MNYYFYATSSLKELRDLSELCKKARFKSGTRELDPRRAFCYKGIVIDFAREEYAIWVMPNLPVLPRRVSLLELLIRFERLKKV